MNHENWNWTLGIILGFALCAFVGKCAADDFRRADEARLDCQRRGGVYVIASGTCAK
jgi:hypothetical protein